MSAQPPRRDKELFFQQGSRRSLPSPTTLASPTPVPSTAPAHAAAERQRRSPGCRPWTGDPEPLLDACPGGGWEGSTHRPRLGRRALCHALPRTNGGCLAQNGGCLALPRTGPPPEAGGFFFHGQQKLCTKPSRRCKWVQRLPAPSKLI